MAGQAIERMATRNTAAGANRLTRRAQNPKANGTIGHRENLRSGKVYSMASEGAVRLLYSLATHLENTYDTHLEEEQYEKSIHPVARRGPFRFPGHLEGRRR